MNNNEMNSIDYLDFLFSDDMDEAILFPPEPKTLNEVLDQINEDIKPEERYTSEKVLPLLVKDGLIKREVNNGAWVLNSTDKGKALGVEWREDTDSCGRKYRFPVFGCEAQEYIRRRCSYGPILEKRGVRSLVHFTRVDVLDNILDKGLLPVASGVESIDDKRLDGRLNCISLSIEYPNIRLLRNGYMRKDRYANDKWAVLVLDPSLLFDHNCYFANYNAASKGIMRKSAESLKTPDAFEGMFADSIDAETSEGVKSFPRKLNCFDCFPTCDQAEIQVEGIIDKRYIKEIWFEDESYMNNTLIKEALRKLDNDVYVGCNHGVFESFRDDYYSGYYPNCLISNKYGEEETRNGRENGVSLFR